jgi:hypothetical protein
MLPMALLTTFKDDWLAYGAVIGFSVTSGITKKEKPPVMPV